MHLGTLKGLYGTPVGPFGGPRGPRRAPGDQIWSQLPPMVRFGPKCPFWGPRRSSEGPGRPDLVLTAPDRPAWVDHMVTIHFDLVLGPLWVRGPRRFGPNCPRLARLGWTRGHHTLCPGIGSLLGPRGPQKCPFWSKCPFLWLRRGPRRPIYNPKTPHPPAVC